MARKRYLRPLMSGSASPIPAPDGVGAFVMVDGDVVARGERADAQKIYADTKKKYVGTGIHEISLHVWSPAWGFYNRQQWEHGCV